MFCLFSLSLTPLTIRQELNINNTQYTLLTNSEDLMKLILIMTTGIYTDRFGGTSMRSSALFRVPRLTTLDALVWGNVIFTVGSILIAASTTVKSFKFMIFGYIIESIGDVTTQVAQYKCFSSWFPPNAGFASTLGLELGIGKIGSFVGKASANAIAKVVLTVPTHLPLLTIPSELVTSPGSTEQRCS